MTQRTCTLDGCDRPHYCKGICKPCYRRDYYRRNRESALAYAKAAYEPEKQRARHQRLKHDPQYQAVRKAAYDRWRREHPDRAKAATQAWRDANRERVRATQQAWIEANPEQWLLLRRAASRTRKLRMKQQAVDLVNYPAIIKRDGMICHLCHEEIAGLEDLHFDHVVPVSRGGEHSMANIKAAHAACNMRKGSKLVSELDWLPVN